MNSGCRGWALGMLVAAWLGMLPFAFADPPLDPEAYDLNLAKGLLAFSNGRYAEAEPLFRAALDAKPGDEDAGYYLGQSQLRLRKVEDAELTFRTMLETNPESSQAMLGLGIVQYHLQQYDDALHNLNAAVKALPDEPLAHFYLGLVYHAREDFDKSPGRFLRAMTLSRDLAPSAHYYAGVAFFKRGVLDEAQEALREVVALGEPDSELVRSAKQLLSQIEDVAPKQPKRWDLILSANLQYDTNVVLLPLGTSPPGGTTGISQKSDVRHSLYFRGEYRPIQTDQTIAGLAYGLYQSFHSSLSNFDVEDHTPSVYVQRQWGPVQTRLQYAFDHVKVGQSPYLVSHSILPSVTINEGGQTYTQVQLRYQNKDFQHGAFLQNSLRDGKNWLAGVTQYVLFANNTGSVRFGYTYDRDRTGGGSPSFAVPMQQASADWAYDGHLVSTGVSFPPLASLKLDLAFDYYRQQYLNPNSFSVDGRTRRRDNIYFFTGTVTHDLTTNVSVGVQYSYTRDQNTVAAFDYNRSVFSLLLAGHF